MMETEASHDQFVLPSELLAEIQAEAAQEHRPALDVLQDAVKRYVREQRWQRTLAYGASRAQALGLSEADVPRLVAESREEQRQGR